MRLGAGARETWCAGLCPRARCAGGGGFATYNITLIPVGAITAYAASHGGVDPNSLKVAQFYPIQGYSDLNVTTNNGRANYHALQAGWTRTRGRYTTAINYTFSKAEGVVNDGSGRAADIFDINKSIGVLPNSRKHLFNFVYSVDLPTAKNINKYAGGFVNGWQVSGIVHYRCTAAGGYGAFREFAEWIIALRT